MAEIIIMPKLGFNMSEGRLVKWYKKEGETITKGENFFAIETDKTNMDIEATRDGVVIKEFISEGDTLEVTLPIAVIGDQGEDAASVIEDAKKQLGGKAPASAEKEAPAEAAILSVAAQPAVSDGGRLMISPRARKLAEKKGIDLNTISVTGTGFGGGICEKDIAGYSAENKVRITPVAKAEAAAEGIDVSNVTGTGVNGKIMKADVENAARVMGADTDTSSFRRTEDGRMILEEIPYAGVRKIIGERLAHSKFTAPHLYFTQKVNMEDVLSMRKKVNAEQDEKTSVTDYIARAAIIALEEFPAMNSALIDDTLVRYKSVNLGIAVAAESGLIVPNLKDAQNMSVIGIAKKSKELFAKARNGKLIPDEYSCGTFTVSNLGMFGIENFTGIINPPEVGILTISSTKDEPFVVTHEDGSKDIEIKPMMNITVSVDHRVIDGLLASQFVTEVKRLLENPISLMI